MKSISRIFIYTLLFIGLASTGACKKKQTKSKLFCDIRYCRKDTVPEPFMDSIAPRTIEKYTGFGDYVQSISPAVFKGKFAFIRFQDNGDEDSKTVMELIDNNAAFEAPERYADFSFGKTVQFTPKIYRHGQSLESHIEVNFIYFYWMIQYFYHEIELPIQYKSIKLNQFRMVYNYNIFSEDTAQKGLSLHTDHYPFMEKLFGTPPGGVPGMFVFGNTDSTFVFNKECKPVGFSSNNPKGGNEVSPIIRSNKFNALNFGYSETADTHVNATVAFDYVDLIQIYAGIDNIPFTADDVFLYAPKFWERLTVKVNSP